MRRQPCSVARAKAVQQIFEVNPGRAHICPVLSLSCTPMGKDRNKFRVHQRHADTRSGASCYP